VGYMRDVYKILAGKSEGKRQRWRRKHRWKDNIEMNLKETRCEGVDWADIFLSSRASQNSTPQLVWCVEGGKWTLEGDTGKYYFRFMLPHIMMFKGRGQWIVEFWKQRRLFIYLFTYPCVSFTLRLPSFISPLYLLSSSSSSLYFKGYSYFNTAVAVYFKQSVMRCLKCVGSCKQ
jgi:hypothetical protein